MQRIVVLALIAFSFLLPSQNANVVFLSATECRGNHGVWRWDAKTDEENPPQQIPIDHRVTPSNIADWPEPLGKFGLKTPRSGREKEWWELVGRIVLMKAEADGDIHIQLCESDAPSSQPVMIVVEVPVGEPWNEIRTSLFENYTETAFPFEVSSDKKLKLKPDLPLVRVKGKAFFDAQHRGKVSNRRSEESDVAVWEIHPVMSFEKVQ